MHRIYIDSDVLLDVFAKREPFYEDSALVLSLAAEKSIEAFITPIVAVNVIYILRKLRSQDIAITNIRKLRTIVKILPVTSDHVDKALSSKFKDFEDALQYFAALEGQIGFIITRNTADYKPSKISVCTPAEFLKIYHSQG